MGTTMIEFFFQGSGGFLFSSFFFVPFLGVVIFGIQLSIFFLVLFLWVCGANRNLFLFIYESYLKKCRERSQPSLNFLS